MLDLLPMFPPDARFRCLLFGQIGEESVEVILHYQVHSYNAGLVRTERREDDRAK